MRYAERQAHLSKLTKRRFTTRIDRIDIEAQGTSFSLYPASGINIVSGGNGSGKSTLLTAIHQSVAGEFLPGRAVMGHPSWLSRVSIKGSHGDESWRSHANFITKDIVTTFTGDVHYIDPAAEAHEVVRLFSQDTQPKDLLEGLDPTTFSADQLEVLSHVLNRRYSEVLAYEVTAFSEDDEPVPYFVVSSAGKTYHLGHMGRGELSCAYLLWRLNRVAEGSLVLLEEPESHLAVYSQDCLVDAIITAVVRRDLTLIVATHSPGFFQKLPENSISLISTLPNPNVRTGMKMSELALHLGVAPPVGALVIVEDQVARLFLHGVLRHVDSELLRRIDICVANSGESGVRRAILDLERPPGAAVRILGVLDGDLRSAALEQVAGFLPGTASPESVIRDALDRWRAGESAQWSPHWPGGPEALRLHLERIDGSETHDWMQKLIRESDGAEATMSTLVDLLLAEEGLAEEARQLARWIRSEGKLG